MEKKLRQNQSSLLVGQITFQVINLHAHGQVPTVSVVVKSAGNTIRHYRRAKAFRMGESQNQGQFIERPNAKGYGIMPMPNSTPIQLIPGQTYVGFGTRFKPVLNEAKDSDYIELKQVMTVDEYNVRASEVRESGQHQGKGLLMTPLIQTVAGLADLGEVMDAALHGRPQSGGVTVFGVKPPGTTDESARGSAEGAEEVLIPRPRGGSDSRFKRPVRTTTTPLKPAHFATHGNQASA